MSNLQKIIGIIIGLSAVVSLAFGADAYFAKSDQLAAVEKRLEQKIVQDRASALQEQLWKIEDRYRGKPKDPVTIDRERRLKRELQDAEKQLEQIYKEK
jgi:hypothetical protein